MERQTQAHVFADNWNCTLRKRSRYEAFEFFAMKTNSPHQIFNHLEKLTYDPSSRDTQKQTAVLLTKAGRIPIFFNPYRQVAACAVPTNFHVHSKHVSFDKILATQPHVQISPTVEKERGRNFPLASIVKGMSFVLVDLTDNPEIFNSLQPAQSPEAELDPEWSPSFVGCMYYRVLAKSEVAGEPAIHNIQARMISHGNEDPGTGSACCALSCFLALDSQSAASEVKSDTKEPAPSTGSAETDLPKKTEGLKIGEESTERKVFGIQQGAEMGRLCTIAIEVDVKTRSDGSRTISNVILSGRSNMMLKGELIGL
jgi:predicted PhzF superfamily epimerase YddE/YHI9